MAPNDSPYGGTTCPGEGASQDRPDAPQRAKLFPLFEKRGRQQKAMAGDVEVEVEAKQKEKAGNGAKDAEEEKGSGMEAGGQKVEEIEFNVIPDSKAKRGQAKGKGKAKRKEASRDGDEKVKNRKRGEGKEEVEGPLSNQGSEVIDLEDEEEVIGQVHGPVTITLEGEHDSKAGSDNKRPTKQIHLKKKTRTGTEAVPSSSSSAPSPPPPPPSKIVIEIADSPEKDLRPEPFSLSASNSSLSRNGKKNSSYTSIDLSAEDDDDPDVFSMGETSHPKKKKKVKKGTAMSMSTNTSNPSSSTMTASEPKTLHPFFNNNNSKNLTTTTKDRPIVIIDSPPLSALNPLDPADAGATFDLSSRPQTFAELEAVRKERNRRYKLTVEPRWPYDWEVNVDGVDRERPKASIGDGGRGERKAEWRWTAVGAGRKGKEKMRYDPEEEELRERGGSFLTGLSRGLGLGLALGVKEANGQGTSSEGSRPLPDSGPSPPARLFRLPLSSIPSLVFPNPPGDEGTSSFPSLDLKPQTILQTPLLHRLAKPFLTCPDSLDPSNPTLPTLLQRPPQRPGSINVWTSTASPYTPKRADEVLGETNRNNAKYLEAWLKELEVRDDWENEVVPRIGKEVETGKERAGNGRIVGKGGGLATEKVGGQKRKREVIRRVEKKKKGRRRTDGGGYRSDDDDNLDDFIVDDDEEEEEEEEIEDWSAREDSVSPVKCGKGKGTIILTDDEGSQSADAGEEAPPRTPVKSDGGDTDSVNSLSGGGGKALREKPLPRPISPTKPLTAPQANLDPQPTPEPIYSAQPFEQPTFERLTNVILLTGPSGSGKSLSVQCVAESMGWEVFEVYPGIGKRSGKELNALVGEVGRNHLVGGSGPGGGGGGAARRGEGEEKVGEEQERPRKDGGLMKYFAGALKAGTNAKSKPSVPVIDVDEEQSTKTTAKRGPKPAAGSAEPKPANAFAKLMNAAKGQINTSAEQALSAAKAGSEVLGETDELANDGDGGQRQKVRQSLILLEEVDILYKEDKGFWEAVVELVARSQRAVVLTCNDTSLLPLETLPIQTTLEFSPVPDQLAVPYLRLVALSEGHILSSPATQQLYAQSRFTPPTGMQPTFEADRPYLPKLGHGLYPQDMRRAMNQLQVLCPWGGGAATDSEREMAWASYDDGKKGISHWRVNTLDDVLCETAGTHRREAEGREHVPRGEDLHFHLQPIRRGAERLEVVSFTDAYVARRPHTHVEDLDSDMLHRNTDDEEAGYDVLDTQDADSWERHLRPQILPQYAREEEMTETLLDLVSPAEERPDHANVGFAQHRLDYLRRVETYTGGLPLTAPILPSPILTCDYAPFVRAITSADDFHELAQLEANLKSDDPAVGPVKHSIFSRSYGKRRSSRLNGERYERRIVWEPELAKMVRESAFGVVRGQE